MKLAAFLILMLLYPLFLRLTHIWDIRAIPLILPYALAALSLIILASEIGSFLLKKISNSSRPK
ncbi:hypothetical protein SAMN02799630_03475 [Paenibacillus sp. UNCCL117]|uniref:hypothetical protein n=1 Tax=unclassified Paenibacillus TaxID=185978 RepID=UPI00087E3E3C|nr:MULTISPECIES: hypothetical protein [unclassified Paenibacillus]SDD42420.1 hypothetical protein SAMN04488602_108144 [Paenibacillus sp. cl123]SFW47617.1 hypothetical protein SAMN02799630_03475 [Paenibacillus sp. UNCCL117]